MPSSNREQQLYLKALEFETPEEQIAFLKDQCGEDLELLESVQALLERQDLLDRFLDSPAVSPPETELPTEPCSTDELLQRKVFGDYELLEEVARGGMGIVYRAEQKNLGRIVALKLILSGQFASRELIHRFKVEATAAAALQHPNIVTIHDVGVHEGQHFLSMDYVYGQNLAEIIGNRPLPAKKAAHYMKKISEAIHYAHGQKILHRDLKPSNVLVDATSDQPRITDFGLAKRLDQESSLTMTGQILGSPHFMAPEQIHAKSRKVGRACDVYGLGSILYFLLTARPPFQGESIEATFHQVLHEEPVAPSLLNPTVPLDLETICLKCLNKEPNRRYGTAQEVAEELARFMNNEPTLARPPTRLERVTRWCRRKPAMAGLIATAALLILTLSMGAPIVAFNIQKARLEAESHLYTADLNRVQMALADADLVHARELLDRHRPQPEQPDPRGFEWRYLWNLCQSDKNQPLEPLVTNAVSVVFSKDGQFLAGANKHASVVWEPQTQSIVKRLPVDDVPLTFSPDGSLLITTGRPDLKRWNTDTWESHVIKTQSFGSHAIYSPDGTLLIQYKNGINVWDTKHWKIIHSNDFYAGNSWLTQPVCGVSHDGKLVSASKGLPYASSVEIRIFSLPSLEEMPWGRELPKDVAAAVFHPKRDLLVTGGWSGDIRLWDSLTGKEIPSNMKQPSRIADMDFNRMNPNLLATTGGDRSVHIWDLTTQQELTRQHGAADELHLLSYSPDGKMIATTGQKNPITLWDATAIKTDFRSVATENRNTVLGCSKDGRRILSVDSSGQVKWREADSLNGVETLIHLDMGSVSHFDPTFLNSVIEVNEDLTKMAVGMKTGEVELWDLTTREHQILTGHADELRGLGISTVDAKRLVTIGGDKKVHLWDLDSQAILATQTVEKISNKMWPICVRFSPDGKWVALGNGKQVTIFDARNLEKQREFDGLNGCLSLRFSQDGRFLASGQFGAVCCLWETQTWQQKTIPGHKLIPADIAFSPDGRRMVTASERLMFWDTDTWQPLAQFKLPIHDTSRLFFSPDGNQLITSDTKAIRVWHAPPLSEINELEKNQGRWP